MKLSPHWIWTFQPLPSPAMHHLRTLHQRRWDANRRDQLRPGSKQNQNVLRQTYNVPKHTTFHYKPFRILWWNFMSHRNIALYSHNMENMPCHGLSRVVTLLSDNVGILSGKLSFCHGPSRFVTVRHESQNFGRLDTTPKIIMYRMIQASFVWQP